MAAASVAQKIREQYPTLAFLINDPEIGKLLTQAVDPNKGFSATTFQAKLYQTSWWRRRSKSAREWLITAHTDPGEAGQKRTLMQQNIVARARQLGIQPTSKELSNIREMALRMGLSPDDFAVTNALVKLARKGGRTDVGAWTTAATELKSSSLAEFVKPLPKHVAQKWTEWIVSGQKTMDDFKAASQAEAVKRYPHMAEQIKAGLTPGEIIAPYRAIIAEELELGDPARVAMNDPRWRSLTGILDPKTKKMRMPTESEVIKMARSQKEYWDTAAGQQAEASMSTALLQAFGKRGGLG